MSTPSDIEFDYVSTEEIPNALVIEQQGYPRDEAGTEDSFKLRQSQAGELFLGVYEKAYRESEPRTLIGFVCSTLFPAETLAHESMSTHVPNSSTICIHSVCVAQNHQRKGIGLALLKEYIHRLERKNDAGANYHRILLITHEELRNFYELAGFEWVGPSDVVHGSRTWFEMRRNLKFLASNPECRSEGHASPFNALEVLGRKAPGVSDLLQLDDAVPDTFVNKYDIVCSRAECGSLVLKKSAAKWVERPSVQLEPEGVQQNEKLPALPTPPETAQWWLVTPSPMAFENVGFSRPVPQFTESGRRMKLLICAECELGPIGWCDEGGSEFWIACSRVAYRGLSSEGTGFDELSFPTRLCI